MTTYRKPDRRTVELVDGRQYYSDDGWETVYLKTTGKARLVDKEEADRVRLLVAYGAADAY